MSLFSKLFGGGGDKTPPARDPIEHNGFLIYPEPEKTSGGHRIGARIEKEVGGEMKSHTMIRADVISDPKEAVEASVNKAKQMIDEQGDGIFL